MMGGTSGTPKDTAAIRRIAAEKLQTLSDDLSLTDSPGQTAEAGYKKSVIK